MCKKVKYKFLLYRAFKIARSREIIKLLLAKFRSYVDTNKTGNIFLPIVLNIQRDLA